MKKLSTLWTKGLAKDKRDELTRRVIENESILDAIKKIIDGKADSVRREQLKPSYDSPAWSECQADRIGYLRAMDEIKTILTLRD